MHATGPVRRWSLGDRVIAEVTTWPLIWSDSKVSLLPAAQGLAEEVRRPRPPTPLSHFPPSGGSWCSGQAVGPRGRSPGSFWAGRALWSLFPSMFICVPNEGKRATVRMRAEMPAVLCGDQNALWGAAAVRDHHFFPALKQKLSLFPGGARPRTHSLICLPRMSQVTMSCFQAPSVFAPSPHMTVRRGRDRVSLLSCLA